MIFSLNAFKPLSSNCLKAEDGLLVLYGKSEVIVVRVLENGELDRIRMEMVNTILRGHYSNRKLAIITTNHQLHIFFPKSEQDLWLPWTHSEYTLGPLRSCFWCGESEILLGFDDGCIKSFLIESEQLSLVSECTKSITFVSRYICGADSGEIFSNSGEIVPTNDSTCPILLDSLDDCVLISKYNTAFLFNFSKLTKEFQVDEQIVGGKILGNQSFQVYSKNGLVYSSSSSDVLDKLCSGKEILGICWNSSFKISVQKNVLEWDLHVEGMFPLSPIPTGILYDACRILSFNEAPMTLSNLAEEIGCSTSAISNLFEDKELFIETQSHNEVLFKAAKRLEEYFVVGSRPIHLTETTYHALKRIGSSGRDGIVQGDLCKLLEIDHKTIFHHLKPLIRRGLVLRFPVTYNRTFTYILLHWSFAEEEPQSMSSENWSASSSTVRELILKTLRVAPNNSLLSSELFAETQLSSRKVYQKAISVLACQGFVECFRGTEIGQRESLIRLKLNKPEIVVYSEDISSNEEVEEDFAVSSKHIVGLPLSFQIKQLVISAGQEGVTSNAICEHLGISSKALHRILGRIVNKPPHCQEIRKQAEFSGRERRFRYFSTQTPTNEQQPLLPVPSFPTSASSSGTASVSGKGESINRTQRINVLLQLLHDNNGLLEVGKPLAVGITSLLKSEHNLDTKTLKRTVTLMEDEGLVRTLTVSVQNVSKLLMMLPDAPQSHIDEFVEQMKKSGCSTTPIVIGNEETNESKEKEDIETDSAVPVDKFEHGFIFGSMLRAKVLHEYLLFKAKSDGNLYTVDSTTAIFRELPLQTYSNLIGIERADEKLLEAIASENGRNLPVSDFKLNMRKLRGVIEKLLELLEQEKLLQGPLSMNIPLTLHLSKSWNSLSLPADFEAVWSEIQSSSVFPERWIFKPLSAKERRAQKKLQHQVESAAPLLTPEDVEYLDHLLVSPVPSDASHAAQPAKEYTEEEDNELMVAISVAFHQRERYARMFASAGKLPFRLLALSLFPNENEREVSIELRRRVKNIAQNSADRQKLRKLDREICFIERVVEAQLLQCPINEALTSALDSNEDEEEEAKDSPDLNQMMTQEFSAVYRWFLNNLQEMEVLKKRVEEYHRNIDKIDLSRLKPIIPKDHVDVVSILETEYRTRSEAIDEYYALHATIRGKTFPNGFNEFRRTLINYILDGYPSVSLEVDQELVRAAQTVGLIAKVGKKKARLLINTIPFQVNSEAIMLPSEYTIPDSVTDIGQESPEGLLTLLVAGDIAIDPETLQIEKLRDPNVDDPEKILKYSWISGRWSILSSEERMLF